MNSEIKEIAYPNGEIQRVQMIRLEDWKQLEFLRLPYAEVSLKCFSDIYREYLVPGCPWIFGNMVMFHLPEDVDIPFPMADKKYGAVSDRLTAAAIGLRNGVSVIGGKPKFRTPEAKTFWETLEKRNSLHVIRGRLPVTTIIPVGNTTGYLSQTCPDAAMKVNASFFIMDRFDCATAYDRVGTPLGLCVKDGLVTNPPLFGREALLVKRSGAVMIEQPELNQLDMEIGGIRYIPGKNARIFTRPQCAVTPRCKGKKLVIIGCQVAAVCDAGKVAVPASGFVLCPEGECHAKAGDPVIYHGMEDVIFGIQVGNSILRDGEKTMGFRSRFYNLKGLEPVAFPPSLYPLDFEKARAARIALGADAVGKPVILWAEGKGKLRYTPGKDSCGASLSEMAHICADAGMVNAVNLDGGGSAQILLNNKRSLMISDRNKTDNTEAERPIPLGLMVR